MLGEVKLDINEYNELLEAKMHNEYLERKLSDVQLKADELVAHIVANNISQWTLQTNTLPREEKLNPFSAAFIVTNLDELLNLGIKLDEIVYQANMILELYELKEAQND